MADEERGYGRVVWFLYPERPGNCARPGVTQGNAYGFATLFKFKSIAISLGTKSRCVRRRRRRRTITINRTRNRHDYGVFYVFCYYENKYNIYSAVSTTCVLYTKTRQ